MNISFTVIINFLEVVQFTNEHQEKDSLGQSQTGKVTIEDSDDTNSDEEQTQKKVHVKYGSTLPVIVLTKSNKVIDFIYYYDFLVLT